MNAALTIAAREFASLFRVPTGWIVLALFSLLTGAVFATFVLIPGQPASMLTLFRLNGWLLLPVVPAISMRLMSDEIRSGTIETLQSAPVSSASVALGKFVAGFAVVLVLLLPTLAQSVILTLLSDPRPDPGPIVSGMLGLVLVGALYLGLGLLISCLTSNQTLAYLGTLLVLLAVLVVGAVPLELMPERLRGVASFIAVHPRSQEFARGLIDTGHVAFFVLWTAWSVGVAGLAIDARRAG